MKYSDEDADDIQLRPANIPTDILNCTTFNYDGRDNFYSLLLIMSF